KNLPIHRSPGLAAFLIQFYQAFKAKLTPIFFKLAQKIEGMLPYFLRPGFPIYENQIKTLPKKVNYRPVVL
ncbi:hypothetical protein AAER49_07910, partial [Acinetobacter baumannii]|uniref:hypothetical protein n=1 Tax=Acinetobacter baumannii TaxID=470 RepID=UPI0031F3C72D